MNIRSYLKGSIRLYNESNHGKFPRTFYVEKIIGSPDTSASAVCYAASYDNRSNGVLKEFYPFNVESLLRNDDGQLIRQSGMDEENAKFDKLLSEYIEPYNMMLEMRKQGDIATFIPPFEFYYGCDENLNNTGTVYIWTPDPVLETFDKVCAEIHENPTVNPEHNLLKVLYSIESLVKCVRELHKAGLIHRDIKPSNFGFLKRNNELLTETISLFDVNTVCSVYSVPDGCAIGTEGYLEPEAINKCASNFTDIYAIGAVLFHAIIVNDDMKETGYLYNPSLYPRIKELVDESKLICASETNSHPLLRAALTRILKKCLCSRDWRYKDCNKLLEDINEALYYLVPAEITDRGHAGEQWVLADVEKLNILDSKNEKNSTLALQYHLYTNPLYEKCENKKIIDVLVIGFGNYGQKFTDIALQIAQMPGKRLRMTIISSDAEDKAVYLSERPELSRFFNIDGSLPDDPESYGDIRFIEHTFADDDSGKNFDFMQELSEKENLKPDYSFIAVGRNKKNLSIAKAVSSFCGMTSLAWEGIHHIAENELQGLIPVYVTEDISRSSFFADVERMAFNVHLIWNKNLNVNFSEVRKEYRKPYNHNSCVSFVLAMKYNLHGIGINIDHETFSETARKYLYYINSHKKDKKNLIYLEHRRWVTEKLCLGYRGIHDLNDCAAGNTRDEKRKRHVCILRSTPDKGLSSPEWAISSGIPNKEKWDNPSPEALSKLDELDRMSVELHLVNLKNAETERSKNLLNGDIVAGITEQIQKNSECIAAWQELLTCMKDIWNNESEQWKRYEGLCNSFIDSVKNAENFSERDKNYIKQLMKSLKEKFYPVFASQQYRDYKKDDVALVEGIPFILTYSNSLYMVIPFKTGNNTEVFSNLAAPTVINPSKLIYAAYCNDINELEAIKKTIPYISNYMNQKNFRANVEFVIGYKTNAKIGITEDIEQEFRKLSHKRISRVKFVETNNKVTYVTELKTYFTERSKNKMNFLFESNNTVLSGVMEGMNIFEEFSSYSYDPVKMAFTLINDCDLLKYIRVKPFITVSDMFSFKMSTGSTSNKPEFYNDYQELWNKYRSNITEWKYLAKLLKNYAAKNDVIVTVTRDKYPSANKNEYKYTLPFGCRKNAEMILNALISANLISKESCITGATTQSCLIIIKTHGNNKKIYDELFSRIDILLQPDFLRCDIDIRNHCVNVIYNDLSVKNLNCENLYDSGFALLDFFSDKGYLINLSYDRNKKTASFSYATPQIKDLLAMEGRMLEIYTYHKAKATGEFNDIRSSFEIDWENSLATNEFDCILTKGFSVLFVECKATADLKTEFYTKLSCLAKFFGINAKAVIIADSLDLKKGGSFNSIQQKHGEQLDVITISDLSDIDDIGTVLLNCIDS